MSLWLLPLVVVVAMWTRSHFRLDELSRVTERNETEAIVSYRGALHVIRSGRSAAPRPVQWDVYEVREGAREDELYTTGRARWERLGFARMTSSQGAGGGTFTSGRSITPWLMVNPMEAWVVPYWPLALLAAVPTAWRTARLGRTALRRRRGQCIACGYDLRASTDRCPECGFVFHVESGAHRPLPVASP